MHISTDQHSHLQRYYTTSTYRYQYMTSDRLSNCPKGSSQNSTRAATLLWHWNSRTCPIQ